MYNVFSKWWHRLRELPSGRLARSVNLRLGLLTPQPLPSSAPRIGEGEEHVFNYLLITRHPSEVELLCGIAGPKQNYGSRVRHMNDGWPGRFRADAPRASSCGTTSATVTACGVRLVHFARHTGQLRLLRLSWTGGLTNIDGTGSGGSVQSV